VNKPRLEDEQAAKARRGRNLLLAWSLFAFVIVVFVITLVKKGGG
jgi:hypothetical protein